MLGTQNFMLLLSQHQGAEQEFHMPRCVQLVSACNCRVPIAGCIMLSVQCHVVLQGVFSSNHWQGWGKDSNIMCPPTQATATQELMCEPSYPGGLNPANMSWTGVVCTPAGTALCLSLPDAGLTGNVSVLQKLSPLNDTMLIDLSGNNLAGTCLWHV